MWRIIRPDSLKVWNNPEVLRRLPRYRAIIDQERIAKYLIAKKLPVDADLSQSTEKLWELHSLMSTKFQEHVSKVDKLEIDLSKHGNVSPSFLDLKIELTNRILANCHFCERKCGADRTKDEKGWCKLGSESRVSSAFLHTGEEAPLVPSGTIFFSSCCLGCVFCQNDDISTNPNSGRVV
ncbi:MAG: pyruvate formate lyase-activating protein, partial [Candidatus Thorarchaeota archaeon]